MADKFKAVLAACADLGPYQAVTSPKPGKPDPVQYQI